MPSETSRTCSCCATTPVAARQTATSDTSSLSPSPPAGLMLRTRTPHAALARTAAHLQTPCRRCRCSAHAGVPARGSALGSAVRRAQRCPACRRGRWRWRQQCLERRRPVHSAELGAQVARSIRVSSSTCSPFFEVEVGEALQQHAVRQGIDGGGLGLRETVCYHSAVPEGHRGMEVRR